MILFKNERYNLMIIVHNLFEILYLGPIPKKKGKIGTHLFFQNNKSAFKKTFLKLLSFLEFKVF